MGWFYKWYVILNDVTCVCNRHWNDRTSGLFSDFQTAFFKWCHFIAVSAGAFRENADGNALFDIFDSLQNGFQAGFHVITFQKQAVKSFHPDVQQRHFFQWIFGNVACQIFAECIRNNDVKIAVVVCHIQHRCIFRNVFLTDNSQFNATDPVDDPKCPLYHPQTADIAQMRVLFSNQPFHKQNRNTENQIAYSEQNGENCS